MKEKPNYYSIIPAEVRYDTELKDKAKLLYGEITALSNINGQCYASNKYFAELFNVSTTTISLLVKNLADKGYIEREIEYKENSKEIEHRYLRIVKGGYLKNLKEGYLRNFKGGIKEKLKDNNINTNNTSNNKEIYKEIIDYLNLKTNKRFKYTNNNINRIKARMNEGFTYEDFKDVIDKKSSEWLKSEKMSIYLRPETLFGTKFESYLNQTSTIRPSWLDNEYQKSDIEEEFTEEERKLYEELTRGYRK